MKVVRNITTGDESNGERQMIINPSKTNQSHKQMVVGCISLTLLKTTGFPKSIPFALDMQVVLVIIQQKHYNVFPDAM